MTISATKNHLEEENGKKEDQRKNNPFPIC